MKCVTFLAKNILVSVVFTFVFILINLGLQGQPSFSNCVQDFKSETMFAANKPILTLALANESVVDTALIFKYIAQQSEEEPQIVELFLEQRIFVIFSSTYKVRLHKIETDEVEDKMKIIDMFSVVCKKWGIKSQPNPLVA